MLTVRTLPAAQLDPLFDAVADCVEESVWNALLAAEDMTGHLGRTAYRIPHELVERAERTRI